MHSGNNIFKLSPPQEFKASLHSIWEIAQKEQGKQGIQTKHPLFDGPALLFGEEVAEPGRAQEAHVSKALFGCILRVILVPKLSPAPTKQHQEDVEQRVRASYPRLKSWVSVKKLPRSVTALLLGKCLLFWQDAWCCCKRFMHSHMNLTPLQSLSARVLCDSL